MKDLIDLDNSLKRFDDIIMIETFIGVNEIKDDVKDMKSMIKQLHDNAMKDDKITDEKSTPQQVVSEPDTKLHKEEEEQKQMPSRPTSQETFASLDGGISQQDVTASNSHKQEEEQMYLSPKASLQDNVAASLGRISTADSETKGTRKNSKHLNLPINVDGTTPSSDQPPKTKIKFNQSNINIRPIDHLSLFVNQRTTISAIIGYHKQCCSWGFSVPSGQQAQEIIETSMEVKHVKRFWMTEGRSILEVANILKVLEELLNAIREAMKETKTYDFVLQRIEPKVESSIRNIRESKQVTYHVNEETKKLWEQINEGKKHVQMCASEKPGCCFKKARYMNKLNDLDNSLDKLCNQVVRIQGQESSKEPPRQADAGPVWNPGKNIHASVKDSQVVEKQGGDEKDNKVKGNENVQVELKRSPAEIHELPLNEFPREISFFSLPSIDGKFDESLRPEQSLPSAARESSERNGKSVKLMMKKEDIHREVKDIRKEFEFSDTSQKTGFMSNITTSLPLKPTDTKDFSMMLNGDASSSTLVVPPKPNVRWKTFKNSSTSVGSGEIAKAKELRLNELVQDMQGLMTKLAPPPNIQPQ